MTQEIVDAVKMLEQEKGIAADTLMDALQDALLSAYKKTPGAAKYAKVELDHGSADFRVYELMVPEDLEKRLLDEQFEEQLQAAEAAEAAGEPVPEIQTAGPVIDPETLYVAVSQSGETYDTLAAVQEVTRKGGDVIGVVNVPGSSIGAALGAGEQP